MIPRPNHITMSTINMHDVPFDTAAFLSGSWDPMWYCHILQMPISEMLGNSVISLAEELIKLTQSKDWVEQRRRVLGQGDIMYLGTTPWLYIFSNNADIFAGADMEVVNLLAWNNICVVRIPIEDMVEECLID